VLGHKPSINGLGLSWGCFGVVLRLFWGCNNLSVLVMARYSTEPETPAIQDLRVFARRTHIYQQNYCNIHLPKDVVEILNKY